MNVCCALNVFTLANFGLMLFTFLMTTLFIHSKDLLVRSNSELQLRYFNHSYITTAPVNLVFGLSESSIDPSGQVITMCECEHSRLYQKY